MKRRDGFTLLELLVVVGLIGILMALVLPAIIKAKDRGKDKRITTNAKALESAIDGYKLRYHKYPAKNSDLELGEDVTYGKDSKDNNEVIDKLAFPPDGSGSDDAFLDLSDYIIDKNGNALKTAPPDGEQYKITLDINADYLPSGGVKVE